MEVPVGASSKNAHGSAGPTVNTRNILFICGGAFPDLENVIKERLNQKSSMGFQADLKDKYDKRPGYSVEGDAGGSAQFRHDSGILRPASRDLHAVPGSRRRCWCVS